MTRSEAQKRAEKKYREEKVKQKGIKFYPAEYDLLEHLNAQPNAAGYIKDLIRRDMENNSK